METAEKLDLDRRLAAYHSTLRSPSLTESLKRSARNWPIYAAVTSSAMAMATGAAAAIVGTGIRDVSSDPAASARPARPLTSAHPAFLNGAKLAFAGTPAPRNRTRSVTTAQAQPTIKTGGIVPIFGTVDMIQPGEWVSIYGQDLATQTATWKGDFPVSLGGVSVTINGKPAFLSYVSPTQINLQAPDDTASGSVAVVITSNTGRVAATVKMGQVSPSFSLLYKDLVAGIILRSNGSGAYGGGSYDILGPTGNSFGYRTVAANPGDTVELFGVGFGPTNPPVAAGKPFSGAAPAKDGVSLYINNVPVIPSFVGLSSAGLFQINLVVPAGLGQGEVPVRAVVGGMQTQAVFTLAGTSTSGGGSTYFGTSYGGGGGGGFGSSFGGGGAGGGTGGTGGMGPTGTGGGGGGTGGGFSGGGGAGGGSGGGSGGSGGGSSALLRTPYYPRLKFSAVQKG